MARLFQLRKHVRYVPLEERVCGICKTDHGCYTHGCTPVAFSQCLERPNDVRTDPAQDGDIPAELTRSCYYTGTPHEHDDGSYVWI